MRKIYNQGHEIASHTWSHKSLTSLTNEEIIAELEYTNIVIERVTKKRPRFFRPPYGHIDDRVRAIVRAMNMEPILWNFDTSDWKLNTNLNAITRNSIYQQALQVKTSVLSIQHDTSPKALDILKGIIDAINTKKMNYLSVGECISRNPYLDHPYVQPEEITILHKSAATTATYATSSSTSSLGSLETESAKTTASYETSINSSSVYEVENSPLDTVPEAQPTSNVLTYDNISIFIISILIIF